MALLKETLMIKLQMIGIISLLSISVSSCTHVPRGSEEQVACILQERIGKDYD